MDHRLIGKFGAAFERSEFDENGVPDRMAAALADQTRTGGQSTAGGEKIIDNQHTHPLSDRIGVHLEAIGAVFEFVGDAADRPGEFAGLSHGHEAGRECLGDGDAEDKATRFGADNKIYPLRAEGVCHEFNGEGKAARIGEEWREVFEDDPGFGIVGHVLDEAAKFRHVVHALFSWRVECQPA